MVKASFFFAKGGQFYNVVLEWWFAKNYLALRVNISPCPMSDTWTELLCHAA
jgi:hypothetical protein